MKKHTFALWILVLAWAGFISEHGFCQLKSQSGSSATIQDFSVSLADLASRVRSSVVQVHTIGFGPVEAGPAGFVISQRGTGSGVILDSEGFIVTNAHVVKGAKHIDVWLSEGAPSNSGDSGLSHNRSATARLVGMDHGVDLAVLKIERTGLQPMNLADSDLLRQGQIVFAFGSPMALENSMTMGVISSAQRQLSPEDPSVYIQTDTPINPGNSGGPLVDVEGRLAGINAFIFSESGGNEGIGFAIPSNMVKRVYEELREEGHIHHGHIGIRPLAVTPYLAEGLRLPKDRGVIFEDVEPGGPSDLAGLQSGDFVVAVDGQPMQDLRQLLMAIDRHAIGDVMQINVLRGSEKIEAQVTVEERADDPNRFAELISQNSILVSGLGILAMNIDETVMKRIPELRRPVGILVAALVEGSPQSEEGLLPGDLIISLNSQPVVNLNSLQELVRNLQIGSAVVLQVQREDQLKFVLQYML